jgi:type IV pilus assembly protein PilC
MPRSEQKETTDAGERLRKALQTMGREETDRPHRVTPAEIGARPPEEGQPLLQPLQLFGPSQLDRAVFCRQLATMIEVGIPLLRALQLLAKRTANPRLAAAIESAAGRVEAGASVSQAFEANKRIFTPLVCNIVRVGEVGGILEDSLVRLAQIIESKAEIKRKVTSALMYPATAVTVAIGVIVLILVKAVPAFRDAYGSDDKLPEITKFIIGLSDWLKGWFWLWLPAIVGAIAAAGWWSRTPRGHVAASWIAIKLPVLGRITRKIGVARFSRTLGGLLDAGVPLIEGLAVAADTNENAVISRALRDVRESVEKGERVNLPLARAKVFPPLVVDMIAIGEETGTLDRMLDKVAEIYDADVDSTLRGLSTIIEPLLIVFLGGVVIFIALAVMLPYFSLVDTI